MKLSECLQNDWICYLLASETLGWLNWVGLALTLVGLSAAIVQSYLAQNAATKAAEAVQSLKTHLDATEYSHLNAQLSTLEHVIGDGQYAVARLYFGPMKRLLRKHAASPSISIGEGVALNRAIDTVRKQLDLGADGQEVRKPQLFDAVNAIMKTVSAWETDKEKATIESEVQ